MRRWYDRTMRRGDDATMMRRRWRRCDDDGATATMTTRRCDDDRWYDATTTRRRWYDAMRCDGTKFDRQDSIDIKCIIDHSRTLALPSPSHRATHVDCDRANDDDDDIAMSSYLSNWLGTFVVSSPPSAPPSASTRSDHHHSHSSATTIKDQKILKSLSSSSSSSSTMNRMKQTTIKPSAIAPPVRKASTASATSSSSNVKKRKIIPISSSSDDTSSSSSSDSSSSDSSSSSSSSSSSASSSDDESDSSASVSSSSESRRRRKKTLLIKSAQLASSTSSSTKPSSSSKPSLLKKKGKVKGKPRVMEIIDEDEDEDMDVAKSSLSSSANITSSSSSTSVSSASARKRGTKRPLPPTPAPPPPSSLSQLVIPTSASPVLTIDPSSSSSASSSSSSSLLPIAVPTLTSRPKRTIRSAAAIAAANDAEADGFEISRRKRPNTSSSSSSSSSSSVVVPPINVSDEWRCSANDSLTFRIIRPAPEKDTIHVQSQFEQMNFHPEFTHQLWEDEEMIGYKRVKAVVAFTSGALYTYLQVDYEAKHPEVQVADIKMLIASKLRAGFTSDYEDFKNHIHDSFVPPGSLLYEYSAPTVMTNTKDIITYEVYRGTFASPSMRDYHRRLQFFLLFFIDRSSYINDADPVWEVILLFQKRVCVAKGVTTYHIVGYTTLYKFVSFNKNTRSQPSQHNLSDANHDPNRSSKKDPNEWKLRLSQILILPPYQRQGHGQRLLQLVYADAERRQMSEVNIEDPSTGFQTLRDMTDMLLCKKGRIFDIPRAPIALTLSSSSSSSSLSIEDDWNIAHARNVQRALRITMQQVRRCFEIFKLNGISDKSSSSKALQSYRADVTARLAREHESSLSRVSTKYGARQKLLAEKYQELETHYLKVIKRARSH